MQIRASDPTGRAVISKSFRKGLAGAFRRLDVWQDPELVENARVEALGVGVFEIRAQSDDLYHVLPYREAAVLNALREILGPGDRFVDAGANIGFYSIAAARLVGTDGLVCAIEMMPDTAARLRHHVELNGFQNIRVFEHALSDRSGDEVLAEVSQARYGRASFVRRPEGSRKESVTLITRTLDELLADIPGPIRLMKMDIEGAEDLALEGASEMLGRTEAVIFEQLDSTDRAAGLLRERGFELSRLDGTNILARKG